MTRTCHLKARLAFGDNSGRLVLKDLQKRLLRVDPSTSQDEHESNDSYLDTAYRENRRTTNPPRLHSEVFIPAISSDEEKVERTQVSLFLA